MKSEKNLQKIKLQNVSNFTKFKKLENYHLIMELRPSNLEIQLELDASNQQGGNSCETSLVG